MAKRTGPTNVYLKQLVENLKKRSRELDAPIWKTVAEKLEKSTRQKVEVNLNKINKHAAEDSFVVVPGIVLGSGEINKAVNVSAWRFSRSAIEKINKSKGKILTIDELVREKPKGTDVKILV